MEAPSNVLNIPSADHGRVPLVTVAICTRNRADFLKTAVESVLSQIRTDAEILIIDNASTDETPAVIAEFARLNPCVRVWREEELGLSAARNAALRRARGTYVIFLDDDASGEPGWLAQYAELFSSPPVSELAGAGGSVFPRYDTALPPWVRPDAHKFDWSDRAQPFKPRGGPWGCNFAVHRERALAVGGFDPALGRKGSGMGAHEESELIEKLRRAGGCLWWLPQARIQHHVAAHRLTFRTQYRNAFTDGRSAALYRMRLLPAGLGRNLFRAGRAMVAPFQCAAGLGAALLILPFCPLHRAASLTFRAARNAGFGLQLLHSPPPSARLP